MDLPVIHAVQEVRRRTAYFERIFIWVLFRKIWEIFFTAIYFCPQSTSILFWALVMNVPKALFTTSGVSSTCPWAKGRSNISRRVVTFGVVWLLTAAWKSAALHLWQAHTEILRNIVHWDRKALKEYWINFLQKNQTQLKEHSGHTVERNAPQLHIPLPAQCQTSRVWLETNTVLSAEMLWELLSDRDVHPNELALPQQLAINPSLLPLLDWLQQNHDPSLCWEHVWGREKNKIQEYSRLAAPGNWNSRPTPLRTSTNRFQSLPTPLVFKSSCFS